ncbi:MAG TPA: TonB-dependent receptor [Chitinophagales bacterium]|nr:TonB-dependent receptor [Chitinophagales bacterium]HRK27719.1 TonB-dependent receptor [Chitinophagales bacterium]
MLQRFVFLLLGCFLFGSAANAQNGVIKGRVYDAVSNDPIPFANVVIQGTATGATTDIDGMYAIENLAAGQYNLQVTYVGYKTAIAYDNQVSNVRPLTLNIALEPAVEQLKEVEIKAQAFSKSEESPVSLRSIGVNEIKRSPGGNRDISRVVQSLPGVATAASFRNDIFIRGGAPSENRFYIDGIEIPVINHFATQGSSGGPVGMINVDFIREVNFYSGAFPVNRGNALSSVFDFNYRDANKDRLFYTATLGASDLGLTVEGPLSANTGFIFSARRSYLQFLFKALQLPFLPIYNDFQFNVRHKINDKNSITLLGIGAIDQFSLNLDANETPEQKYLLANLPVNEQWNYTVGAKYTHFAKNNYTNVVISRSHLNNSTIKYAGNDESKPENLLIDYNSQEIENKLRIENIARFKGFKLLTGINYELATYTNNTFNNIPVNGEVITIDLDVRLNVHKWGAFAQLSKNLFNEKLTLSAGVRTDANNYSDEMSNLLQQLSPRFSASYALLPTVNLNFNTGIYYQLPPYTSLGYQENGVFVNKQNKLTYIQNRHVVGGVEWNLPTNARITAEGFFKRYTNYPFSVRDSISLANVGADFGVVGNEEVTSISNGRTYGAELLFQQKLYKGLYAIAAYTLSWSEFEDKNGKLIPSSWDARHILNLTGGIKFKRNWELGARWRFSTGQPFTPTDVATSSLIPVWDVAGRGLPNFTLLNTERNGVFHNLDVRVDKKWFLKRWNLNLFLDVQNIYNFQNQGQPFLDVVRSETGAPLPDPNNPGRYQTTFLQNVNGTVLPNLGVVVEF